VLADRWIKIERLFAEALAQPQSTRSAFLERACGVDGDLRDELNALLLSHEASGVLDVVPHASGKAAFQPSLAVGTCLGPWRIDALIGRGGMGEVYAAIRADTAFEQRAAIKLLRHEAVGGVDRFHAERRILLRLEHPGIARLLDGGNAPDGRPYTVMDYVEGCALTDYCRQHASTLQQRLALYVQVCDAVAFAHRNLVIHRDLKPDNILVSAEGKVKLLDFGIAKLLDASASAHSADTTIAPFTPDYAAPEQLSGQPVSTATDIYALGVLLFELLTGERPLRMRGLPSTQALQVMLDRTAPAPSRIAQAKADAPLAARLLTGDLDAIVAKCLRKESGHRYETVNALMHDIECHQRGEPVQAREGARLYVLGRALRRYRWAVAAVGMLIVTLAAGLVGTMWQARRAELEGARAAATKDFLLSVFSVSDPRVASDKPRGEITAKEMLDFSSARIESNFSDQPEMQIEMLGVVADIYQRLRDDERYVAMQNRRIELARAHYGAMHPIVMQGLVVEADVAFTRQEFAKANRLLDEVDVSLKASGQDRSLLRAKWWRTKARVLSADADSQNQRAHAADQALLLYAELAPHGIEYARALNVASRSYTDRGAHTQALQLVEQALSVAEAAPNRDDALIAIFHSSLAHKYENLGQFVAAESAHERADKLALRTWGGKHPNYWMIRATYARLLHQRGQRERANALFTQMLRVIPPDWETTKDPLAYEQYAECLAAEGRARDAIAPFEVAHQAYLKHRNFDYNVREVRRKLGDAYDRLGRTAEARSMLEASLDEYLAKETADSQSRSAIRERWGRLLLDHSQPGDADFAAAESELRAVLVDAADRPWLEPALAHSGLARIALAQGDSIAASNESQLALTALQRVQGLYDIRAQPALWLVHSAVLLKRGDVPGARHWAERALQASRTYDDPSSPAITEAEIAVRAATAASGRK
jgi:eukaryotic-like serine/threonine-protein kinase